jgi:hypothetical protein
MSDDTQMEVDGPEVDRLVGIARLHAWNALAQSPAQRDAHLAVARDFWKHYAEAFATSDAQCEEFADALGRATRELMAEMRKNIAAIHQAGGFRRFEEPAQAATVNGLTLEELRPIFRQIIGQ